LYKPREQIYAGLLTFLQQAVGFQTVTRVTVPEAVIAGAAMPMLEQLPSAESAEETGINLPPKWMIKQPLAVYCSTSDPDVLPDTVLNNLLDAIETALKPNPATGYQTLNGLVVSCRFRGVLLKEPGYQAGVGAALVMIEMRTTS
jgi:hypothetical protein